MNAENFRIIELKYAHPVTGARFWIEWFIEVEVERKWWINKLFKGFGIAPFVKKEMRWEIFNDPASTEINKGYLTIAEATYAIERYLINLRPIVHKYEKLSHSN